MTISSKPAKKKPILRYLLIGAALLAGAAVIAAPLVARSIGGAPGMRTAAQDAAAVGTMKSIVSASSTTSRAPTATATPQAWPSSTPASTASA